MANVSVENKKVKKMVEVFEEKKVFTLELSQEELNALSIVLRVVGGCPRTSIRKYTEEISDVIHGHTSKKLEGRVLLNPNHRHLYFRDNTINEV